MDPQSVPIPSEIRDHRIYGRQQSQPCADKRPRYIAWGPLRKTAVLKIKRGASMISDISMLRIGAVAAAFFLFLAAPDRAHANGPQGTVIQFTVPKQGSMIADATYYCWLPSDMGTARSVIVHQHGCTREGDAQQMVGDVQWLSLARKWHSVFIAPKLITGLPGSGSSTCGNWNNIENGSGNAFLAALDTLARRSSHPEIKTIPWALWGHSGGSMWITSMAGKYPDRVAVGIAQSCGSEISGTAAALRIPILHHNGKKDMCYNDKYFANGRIKGALWAHAVNPDFMWVNGPKPEQSGWGPEVYGHAPHDLRMIAIPWIEAGLARLPAEAGAAALKPADTSGAWLGDTATHAVAAQGAYPGNKLLANWLPNEAFAGLWKEYMETGTIKDKTPPPAPSGLAGAYANRQIKLTWNADADLETGIKTFIVYRNGSAVATLQYNTTTLFTAAKGYQRWDDGDNPNPSTPPAMTYTDINLSDTATYTYQVATVNWSDLAGSRSDAITLKRGQVTALDGKAGRGGPEAAGPVQGAQRLILCKSESDCILGDFRGAGRLYDLKGNLVKRVTAEEAVSGRLGALPGAAGARMLILRPGP
jgi:pimeloyl-ACP methyl ester carboxylesterase